MSRRKASNSGGGKFKRLLGWTVLIAIVFSAGLITGERLVRRQNLAPLVSVTDQVARPSAKSQETGEAKEEEKDEPTFAFFDQLTRKDEVSLSSKRKEPKKPEAKPKAQKPRPDKEPEPQKAKKAETAEKVEEAEPANKAEKPAARATARYTLQVAAHPDMNSAKAHMERLRKMGLEPHLVSAAIPGKGKFYRVRVGKFQSMDEARSFQSDLKRKNSLSTFVSPL